MTDEDEEPNGRPTHVGQGQHAYVIQGQITEEDLEELDHDCGDDLFENADWSFEDLEFQWGNKPLTAEVPGRCEVCGDHLALQLEVTGAVREPTREVIHREH